MKDIFNTLASELEVSGIIEGLLETLLIAFAVGLVCWVFGAIGIYKMSKNAELKYSWLSFIYPIYPFALGRIAQKYIKKDGTKSANLSVWLLVLSISGFVLTSAFFAVGTFAVFQIVEHALDAIEADISMTVDMFSSAIPAIILYFVALAAVITYLVMYYIALWRIFSMYSRENAILFLILSVVLSILAPFFIFIIRNKTPQFDITQQSKDAIFELAE